jgi:hypothetical protein
MARGVPGPLFSAVKLENPAAKKLYKGCTINKKAVPLHFVNGKKRRLFEIKR